MSLKGFPYHLQLRKEDMKTKTYRCNSCTVKINWLGHGSWELHPLKSLQVQLPDIPQDHFSVIAATNEHIYREEETPGHTKERATAYSVFCSRSPS